MAAVKGDDVEVNEKSSEQLSETDVSSIDLTNYYEDKAGSLVIDPAYAV